MSTDMNNKTFESTPFGKAALRKLGDVPENFRLYSAGWLGGNPKKSRTMKVTGAEFRVAKKGPNKGKLSVMVPNTRQTVHVSREEIEEFM